nr:hypothetical protein [Tanacetum cinerariifolium]
LDAFPRDILTFGFTFPILNLGFWIVDSKATLLLKGFATDWTKMPMAVPVSSREPKRIVNQSVAKPFRRRVALESTIQKPRHTNRKQYENVSKACS